MGDRDEIWVSHVKGKIPNQSFVSLEPLTYISNWYLSGYLLIFHFICCCCCCCYFDLGDIPNSAHDLPSLGISPSGAWNQELGIEFVLAMLYHLSLLEHLLSLHPFKDK